MKFLTKKKYDLILANHNSCIKYLRKILPSYNIIIQTCHGIYPKLEQPTWLANGHISISKEVQEHLKNKGYNSNIIFNGINTKRFEPKNKINKVLKKVLSLCQSEKANNEIQKACKQMNIEFHKLNKFKNPIWDVEKKINDVDLVVGIGRSAYEAMSCGRPVVIYDNRPYSKSYADGYVTPDIIQQYLIHNMSGRSFKKSLSVDNLKNTMIPQVFF